MVIISVVRNFEMYDRLVRNNRFNQGCTFAVFDNREINRGISLGYNEFLDGYDYSKEAWFVFCHEDWEIQEDWVSRVEQLPKESLYGPVGARVVFRTKIVLGRIKNSTKDGTGLKWEGTHVRTGCMTGTFDCQCLIVHSSLIQRTGLRFDPKLVFDFYVEEFCMHARERHGVVSRIIALACQHYSFGNIYPRFYDAVEYVRQKYPAPHVCYSSTATQTLIGTPRFIDILFMEKELLMIFLFRYIYCSKITKSKHRLIKIFNIPVYHAKCSLYKSIPQMIAYNQSIGRGFDANGLPRPLKEREFFEVSEEMGFNQNNSDYRELFENLAAYIRALPDVRSALEIGCGPGYLIACLNNIGIDTVGVDGNRYSKDFFAVKHPEFTHKYHLDPIFSGKYEKADLIISIECFEHIPDAPLNQMMEKVRCEIQPKYILFSSSPHPDPNPNWDFQWGHVNIKQPAEWRDFFFNYGYELTKEVPPVTLWASLYKKIDQETPTPHTNQDSSQK